MIKHADTTQCETVADFYDLFTSGPRLQAELKTFDVRLPVADKAEWVNALLSGNYTQGSSRLKTVVSFNSTYDHCCLGVLCEIRNLKQTYAPGIRAVSFEEQNAVLPNLLTDRYGITPDASFVYTFTVEGIQFGMKTNLAHLNDERLTFAQIADVINYFF